MKRKLALTAVALGAVFLAIVIAAGMSGERYVEEQLSDARQRLLDPSAYHDHRISRRGVLTLTSADDRLRLDLFADAGAPLRTLALPANTWPVYGYRDGDLLGLVSSNSVIPVDESLKLGKEFTTGKQREIFAVRDDRGRVFFLRYGDDRGPVLGADPRPLPAGFTLYDSRGKKLLERGEDSDVWAIGLLRSSIVVSGEGHYAILGFDGRVRATVSMPEKRLRTNTRIWFYPSGTHVSFICSRYKVGFAGRMYDHAGRKVLDLESQHHMTLDILGDTAYATQAPGGKTCRIAAYDLASGTEKWRTDVELDVEYKMPSTRMGLFPGREDRLLVYARTRDTERNVHVVWPLVFDAASGKLVWRGPMRPDKHESSRPIASAVPWDDSGLLVNGRERGLALLRPANGQR